jgi:hypothetical protein
MIKKFQLLEKKMVKIHPNQWNWHVQMDIDVMIDAWWYVKPFYPRKKNNKMVCKHFLEENYFEINLTN